jgi:hypothetical protein
VDVKDGCKSVSKGSFTTLSPELFHGPLHSDCTNNCIKRLDGNFTTWSDEELKPVGIVLESVLSTGFSWQLFWISELIVELHWCNFLTVCSDGENAWSIVRDLNLDSFLVITSAKTEAHCLGWGSSESDCMVETSLNHDWESLESLLAGIETIP